MQFIYNRFNYYFLMNSILIFFFKLVKEFKESELVLIPRLGMFIVSVVMFAVLSMTGRRLRRRLQQRLSVGGRLGDAGRAQRGTGGLAYGRLLHGLLQRSAGRRRRRRQLLLALLNLTPLLLRVDQFVGRSVTAPPPVK